MKNPLALAIAPFLLLSMGPGSASAQEVAYPNKPITVLIGYPPGGSTDLTGRAVADQLARKLGVLTVVGDEDRMVSNMVVSIKKGMLSIGKYVGCF